MFEASKDRNERFFFTLSDEIRTYIEKISGAITKHIRNDQIENIDLHVVELYINP